MIFKYKEFKEIRKDKRWSLGELGKAVGISRRSLTNWENGHSEPKEVNIRKLASFLNVSVNSISDLHDTIPVSDKSIESSTSEFMSFYKEELSNKKKINQIITSVKALENKLNESSLVINAIISSINTPIYIKDINQKYVLANEAFIEHLGLKKEFKVSGKTDYDLFSQKEAIRNIKEDQKIIETGNEIFNKEKFIPGSRGHKWGLISKYPIYDSENKISGVFGLFLDITERTKNENMRKLLETAFLNNSSTVLHIFNSKSKLLYISDSIERVYGYPKENYTEDKNFWINTCIHPDNRARFAKFQKLNEWPEFLQYKGLNSKKQTKWFEATSYKFKYLNTECTAFFERDISSQKSLVWRNIAMYEIINKIPNTVVWSGVFDKNNNIKFDFITDNVESITGYDKSDIISGKHSLLSLIDDNSKKFFNEWNEKDEETLNIEHGVLGKNKKFTAYTQIFSIVNENDQKTYFGMHTVK